MIVCVELNSWLIEQLCCVGCVGCWCCYPVGYDMNSLKLQNSLMLMPQTKPILRLGYSKLCLQQQKVIRESSNERLAKIMTDLFDIVKQLNLHFQSENKVSTRNATLLLMLILLSVIIIMMIKMRVMFEWCMLF